MKNLFRKRLNQDEKLLKNIERYDEKEKTKQQKSQILGQKPVKGTANKEKSTSMYNSPRV
mgnify:CR=1 FL=1|tara:strand:+ start:273 stop:452 length:180 start_codon:yes stop_codon:yes gene_type:complete